MAVKKNAVNFVDLQQKLIGQFRDLDRNNPAAWPILPKLLLGAGVAALVLAAIWYFFINDLINDLEGKRKQEEALKTQYVEKYGKVINLESLLKQRQQVEQYVAQLEKQLPGRAEMDALLSDINQAGVGRNLQFELFKPSKEEIKNYYALLPVSIKVSGKFPDVAGFASDIAHLSRIVTLSNISIDPGKDQNAKDNTVLQMQATANTYRYLDKSEMPAQKNPKDKDQGAKKP